MAWSRSLVAVSVVLAATVARAADRPLAVLPLGGDAAADVRRVVEERVRVAAGRYAPVQAADAAGQALRSAAALGLSCDLALVECARKMGGLAGAARVLAGTLDTDDTLALGLIEVSAVEVAAVTEQTRLPAAGVARDAAIERLVMLLLAPERVLAQLSVDAAPVGARVAVDGVFRGPAPLTKPITLSPGRHAVEVTLPGWLSQTRDVMLEAGAVAQVRLELEPDPDAPVFRRTNSRDQPQAGSETDDERSARRTTVAIFPFMSLDVPHRVAPALEAAFTAELGRREGVVVVAAEEVAGSLEGVAPSCRQDQRCLAEVARALEVDAFVTGQAAADGKLWTLSIARHDAASGVELTAARTSTLAQDRASVLVAVPDLADQLFPEHAVVVGARPIDLRALADRMVGPPLPPWAFWASAGAGAVLAVATAGAGAVALTADNPVDAGRAGGAFAVGAGATVVALGAAAVIGVFVDWQ